jgi:hypothetical protein
MFQITRLWLCSMALAVACAAVGHQDTRVAVDPQTQKKQPAKKSSSTSLTGCVDQQDGQYVLIDDRTTGVIAILEAAGFPQEGFAMHLGHKVTVKGTSSSKEGRSVFQVRSVEKVSDVCAPQQF